MLWRPAALQQAIVVSRRTKFRKQFLDAPPVVQQAEPVCVEAANFSPEDVAGSAAGDDGRYGSVSDSGAGSSSPPPLSSRGAVAEGDGDASALQLRRGRMVYSNLSMEDFRVRDESVGSRPTFNSKGPAEEG